MMSRVLVAAGLLCVQATTNGLNGITDELNHLKSKKSNGGGSQQSDSQAQGGSQSGNYQQYMNKYAGQYTGGQGGSQSGNYQQYMKEYAGGQGGNYQKYMNQYAGGQGGSQSGGYQHYYQQYMSKYAGGGHGGSAGSEVNLNSKDSQGGYQQYMSQYAGGQGGSSGGYQKYMKQYAGKYMKQYAGNQGGSGGSGSPGGSQSGDYQQYMTKYAGGQGGDYQKYMTQYAGGSQGGSQSGDSSAMELLEQSAKKTSDSSTGSELNLEQLQQPSSGKDGYQNYVNQYAGNYAGKYMKYMNNKECKNEAGSASDAKTVDELDKWYSGAKVNVKCYVPDEDASYADSDLHKEYKKRLAELDKTTSPIEASEELVEKPQNEELVEKPHIDEKTQMAQKSAKTFLAKSEIAQSEVAANLALFADQMNSDPVTVVGMALLGVAFACFSFFAVRHRRSVQVPTAMLG